MKYDLRQCINRISKGYFTFEKIKNEYRIHCGSFTLKTEEIGESNNQVTLIYEGRKSISAVFNAKQSRFKRYTIVNKENVIKRPSLTMKKPNNNYRVNVVENELKEIKALTNQLMELIVIEMNTPAT